MVDVQDIARDVILECSSDVELVEVLPVVKKALNEEDMEREELVSRLALVIDAEMGAAQEQYEEYVLAQGGFVVEDGDGVVYGFSADGESI